MSNKIKGFNGGGPTYAPTAYAPRGGNSGSTGFAGGLNYLDYGSQGSNDWYDSSIDLDALAAIINDPEFRMQGVTKPQSLEQRQIEAAQEYADLVLKGPRTFLGTREGIADLNAAKQKLIALDVSRGQIAATGVDASQGIVGVMGPSVSGVLDNIGQGAIDLIGAGGQKFSDIITLGQGPDVAQTLLDPFSILTGGFGGTINYGDRGKSTPLIVGNTTASGMPVGLGIPDPRAIWQEGVIPWLTNNGAGLVGPAAAAVAGGNTLDSTKKTGAGVGLSGASLIAAAAALDKDSDAVKTGAGDIIAGAGGSDSSTIKTGARNIATGDVDSDSPVIKTGPMSDAELDAVLTDLGGRPAVDGGYDTPSGAIKTSSPAAIKTGGGGVTPEQIISQGSMETISTKKAGVADITALYNPALSLAENMALLKSGKAKEEDAVNSALMYGGGIVQPTDINAEMLRILGSH